MRSPPVLSQSEAVIPQRFEGRPAGEDAHRMPGKSDARRDPAADGARSDYANGSDGRLLSPLARARGGGVVGGQPLTSLHARIPM
jgi:hypothetical protein